MEDKEDYKLFIEALSFGVKKAVKKKLTPFSKDEESDKDRHMFEEYLSYCEPPNKDRLMSPKPPKPKISKRAKDLSKVKIENTLDLHGYTREESEKKLFMFLKNAYERGLRIVCVIHGKGKSGGDNREGILKKMVRQFLKEEGAFFVRDYAYASKDKGGDGATIIWIQVKP